LGTIAAAKLETLTITGSGGVTADVANDGDTTNNGYVTSVNTSGSTATVSAANGTTGNNITIGVSTDFVGGAGVDNLTVGASTRALSLGAGNDKLVLTAALAGTATTGGTADGGDGTDTLETGFAIAVTAGSSSGVINSKITGFERLSITDGTLTTDVTVDFDYLPKINSYVKLGAFTGASTDVLTLANLANNSTIELTGAFGTDSALAATIKGSSTSTTDVLNLRLASNDTLLGVGSVTANGIETINITSTNSVTATLPATRLDTLTLAADAVKNIVVSGAAGLNLTNTNTTVLSVDASGITGTTAQPNAFTYTSGVLTNATNAPITVTGTSAGANTINMDAITNSLINVTITVGGSANISSNVFTGGAGIENVTGGSGTDSFTMKEGRDVITTGAGSDKITFATTAVDRDTVTDFTVGAGSAGDKIISANFTSAEYNAFTTRTAAYTYTGANTTGHTLEFAIEGNSTVNLNDNSADSLTGVNLLKALNDGVTAATITLTTITDSDVQYVVGYQGGKAFIYNVASGGTATTLVGTELALVGVLDNVALGALTADNFIAS
jgi:S-layer protein